MPNSFTVIETPCTPNHRELSTAHKILEGGIDSVNNLARHYRSCTQKRGPGAPTHEDQDLLRAMLVMAGAALDATVKEIVRKGLPLLLTNSDEVLKAVSDRFQRDILAGFEKKGIDALTQILLSPDSQNESINYVIKSVTKGSMQNHEALYRVVTVLLPTSKVKYERLKDAFSARNQIVHEMDATPDSDSRNRRQRSRKKMETWAKQLLKAGVDVLNNVDKSLPAIVD